MANRTIAQLDVVTTADARAAGTSNVLLETQISGLSSPESRQVTLDQISDLIVGDANLVRALSSDVAMVSSSATFTGSSAIDTGLGTLANVVLTIRGFLDSTAAAVSWSALASAGWFSAFVYANPSSSSSAAPLASVAATVDWIAVGTL